MKKSTGASFIYFVLGLNLLHKLIHLSYVNIVFISDRMFVTFALRVSQILILWSAIFDEEDRTWIKGCITITSITSIQTASCAFQGRGVEWIINIRINFYMKVPPHSVMPLTSFTITSDSRIKVNLLIDSQGRFGRKMEVSHNNRRNNLEILYSATTSDLEKIKVQKKKC